MYEIVTDQTAQRQVDALPAEALALYAEARTALELDPLSGEPLNKGNPEGGLFTLTFGPNGEGIVYYLVIEHLRRLDVLAIRWFG